MRTCQRRYGLSSKIATVSVTRFTGKTEGRAKSRDVSNVVIKAVFWIHIRPSPGEYEEQCLQRSRFTGDSLLCLRRRPGPSKLRSAPARPQAALPQEDGAVGRRHGGREPGVRPERQGSPQPGVEAGRGLKRCTECAPSHHPPPSGRGALSAAGWTVRARL